MRIKKTYLLILVLGMMLMSYSCVKDLDFEQLNQAELTPVLEADFIYSTFDISQDIPPGTLPGSEIVISDTVDYDLVGSDFAIDNLDNIELTIEVLNTIEIGFRLEFQFLTGGDVPTGQLYSLEIMAGNGIGTTPVLSSIIIELNDFTELINAEKIATEIRVTPPSNNNLSGVVDIRSKASYYIRYPL